jgi:hypothetical protein
MSSLKVTNLQNASAASPAFVLASDGTATANLSSLNGGPIAGSRNRIINGDMRIDQRNAGASVTLADGIYNIDRWQGSVSQVSKVSIQRSAVAPDNFTNSQLLTVTSPITFGAGDYCGNAQSIEGFNTADLSFGTAAAKPVTVSFWVRSSIAGPYSATLQNEAFNRTNSKAYTISSANTWEYKTITFTGDTSGTWLTDNRLGIKIYFALGMGSTYGGATDGSWTSTPKLAVTGQTNWASTNGATFYITGVQLEPGSVATPFERRSYGAELALCQRYFETSYPSGVAPGAATSAAGMGGISLNGGDLYTSYSPTPFAVIKRAGPTITFYAGTTGQQGVLYNLSLATVQGNAGARFATQNGVAVFCSNNAMSASNAFSVNYTASAEL